MVKKSEIVRMCYDKICDDSSIYAATDGNIFMGLPEEDVENNLSDTHETCISITMADSISRGTQGSATSKIKDVYADVTIDVGSRYNNSSMHCMDVLELIENISFYDVSATLGASNAYMFVTKEISKVFYDNTIKAYHGILTLELNYRTIGT